MGSQRVGHDWATELNWFCIKCLPTQLQSTEHQSCCFFFFNTPFSSLLFPLCFGYTVSVRLTVAVDYMLRSLHFPTNGAFQRGLECCQQDLVGPSSLQGWKVERGQTRPEMFRWKVWGPDYESTLKTQDGEFPGGPVVRTPCFHGNGHRGHGSIPGQIQQATWLSQKTKSKQASKQKTRMEPVEKCGEAGQRVACRQGLFPTSSQPAFSSLLLYLWEGASSHGHPCRKPKPIFPLCCPYIAIALCSSLPSNPDSPRDFHLQPCLLAAFPTHWEHPGEKRANTHAMGKACKKPVKYHFENLGLHLNTVLAQNK